MIKDNGGLMKLVAYITDTTPPEDEDPKKGGKKEKAASRAGKKGKDDGKLHMGILEAIELMQNFSSAMLYRIALHYI